MIFIQNLLKGGYTFASNIIDCETIFDNVYAICHVRGGLIVTKGYKLLKFQT